MNLWRFLLGRPKPPEQTTRAEPFRCGTPYLQSGGIVLVSTDNVVTILRGERNGKSGPAQDHAKADR